MYAKQELDVLPPEHKHHKAAVKVESVSDLSLPPHAALRQKWKVTGPSVNCQLLDQHQCRGSELCVWGGAPREQTNRTSMTLGTCAVTFHSQKMMQQHRDGRGGGGGAASEEASQSLRRAVVMVWAPR